MAVIGEAYIAVKPDTQGFAANAEKGVLGGVTGIAKKAAGILAGAFVAQKGIDFLKDSVAAARESNAVAAQTAAVIKSTGGAANQTAKEVDALSTAISRKTGIDDEQISKAQNLLLTFTNVRNEAGKGNDVFNQATKVMVDMGKALGTDASGAAIQLGKALNDPIAGISALSRVGVTFNDEQKRTIEGLVKTGKTAEAQKIILAELNKEFGGSAEAQATASDKLKVTLGNLQEELGNKLIPIIDKVASFIADKLPGALDFLGGAFARARDVVGPIIATIGNLVDNLFGGFSGRGTEFVGAFDATFHSIGQTLRGVFEEVQLVITGVVAFIQENAPKFQEAFERIVNAARIVFETLEPIIRPIVEFAVGAIIPIIENLVNIIKNVALLITNIINGDFKAAFGNLVSIVRGTIETAISVWSKLPGMLLQVAGAALSAALSVGRNIMEGIGRGLSAAAGFAGDVAGAVLKAIRNLINTQVIDRLNRGIRDSLAVGPLRIDLPDNPIPRLARGGIARARPGGIIANIAEGGQDEAVIPLPPGLVEGLQALASGARTYGAEPLIGQLIVQGVETLEGAHRAAIEVVRELRAEAWRQGK